MTKLYRFPYSVKIHPVAYFSIQSDLVQVYVIRLPQATGSQSLLVRKKYIYGCQLSECCINSTNDDCTEKAIHPFYFSCKDPSEECPETMVYNYSVKYCNQSCHSLDEPDPLCKVQIVPMEGCSCPEGTYLNDEEECVTPDDCPCYYKGKIVQPGNSFQEDKLLW